MEFDEIKKMLNKLSPYAREKFFKNLKRINFKFTINKSFLSYSNHPITIPKEFYPFLDIHAIIKNKEATIVFPDGSTAEGFIYYLNEGWGGEYHQIRMRNPYSGVGISNYKVGDVIRVEIFKIGENTHIELSNL